jgi:hypothetical protein
MSTAKTLIRPTVEKYLKKEIENIGNADEKLSKMKSVLNYLSDDDCFCIIDPECSIKCIFSEEEFKKALEKKGGKKENLDSKFIF